MILYFIVAGLLVVAGVGAFLYTFSRHRECLHRKRWPEALADVVFHIPDEQSRALPHIIGIVCCSVGICLGIGTFIGWSVASDDLRSLHSLTISTGAFTFGIFVSCVSVWTLWQTLRIDHNQGYRIKGFPELIDEITDDLKQLAKDFIENHSCRALDYHRVSLITTNPFFGMLSYPTESFTHNFQQALAEIASCVNLSVKFNAEHSHGQAFRFEVICGNDATLNSFHEVFLSADANKTDRAKEMTAEVKKQIELHEKQAESVIYSRVSRIPPTQFMVIGNNVYEFTLEASGQRSEIYDTDVRRDRRAADKSLATFEILKTLK